MKFKIDWKEKLAFSAQTPSGHEIRMDASEEIGGENSGARPTELLLTAVAGCTGIDIIMILNKMRLHPSAFQMEIEGQRADYEPKKFTNIRIHYRLEGDIPEDKLVRAIKLSLEKYCSVAHSVLARIEASYVLNGTEGKVTF